MNEANGLAHDRYEYLIQHREHVLRVGREVASLTVPHLLPPQGHTATSDLPKPYQSLGSRGIRNLSSKLLLTLFPPNTPFFKYSIDDLAVIEIEEEGGPEARGQIEEGLSIRERAVMKEVEASFFRTAAFEAFRQLLVAGNVCIFIPEAGHTQVFRLDTFVVKRDPEGTVLEGIIKQNFAIMSLEERAQKLVTAENNSQQGEDNIALYTYIRRTKKGKYEVWQEVSGQIIPGTKSTYAEDLLPYRFLRLTKIDGEDYGRGYGEELLGDLVSFEGLSQSLLEGASIMSRMITMVSPNGTTNAKDVQNAENGDVISGNPEDVAMLQAEKRADMSVAQNQAEELNNRLQFAFLLNTAIQRNGERVTAEEIRYMAQELEDGLGGMYSLLAQEFQLPMVHIFSARMERNRQVPELPKDLASPAIVTGIDALGRGHDLRNLDMFLAGLGQQFGPEVLGRYIMLSEAIKRRGVALGVDMNGLVKSEEEVAQAEQQAQMQQLAQNMGPQAIQAMAQLQGKDMDNESKETIAAAQQET
tara:strand:- start:2449 stop:4035 length:1587 start_codon:yes stop_codon:yes gene_type:complete